ncbi:MAG: GTPase ObgE [Planctomycetota bacterium]|jgi:GTP-binding protein|nr:GTPase ObgE [Planctomycetota bacterium]
MEFVDEAKIIVRSGKGGNGTVAFRHERNVPLGGPTGGDGGAGGSVSFRADLNRDTLLPLARTRCFFARDGQPGGGNNRSGATADDILVPVPVGTVFFAGDNLLADLDQPGEEWLAAPGGRGGRGNAHFASPTNRTPHEYTRGEEGQELDLRLELKLIADVGLLGLPNAGKSTLLSRLSAARPKIADYPFTTLKPQLGIVPDGYGHELVMADIPGIIAGAAEGAGMGMRFLRHVERCHFLLHLLDISPLDGSNPLDNLATINQELLQHSPALAEKPQLVVVNKMDLPDSEAALAILHQQVATPVIAISAVTGQGIKEMLVALFNFRQTLRHKDNATHGTV